MFYNIDFDIAALVIDSFLIGMVVFRKGINGIVPKVYKALLYVSALAVVFDLISVPMIAAPRNYSAAANYFVNIAYLCLQNMIPFIFAIYGTLHLKLKIGKKRILSIFIAAGILEILLIATTPITGLVFTFDETGAYTHGTAMTWLYVSGFLAIVFVLIIRIANHDTQSTFQLLAISSYVFITLLAYAVVYFMPEVLITGFTASVGLTIMFIAQDSPEFFHYKGLNIFNREAFNTDVAEIIREQKIFKVLFFCPRLSMNFRSEYDDQYIFAIEKRITKMTVSVMKNKPFYCLGNMVFAVIFEEGEFSEEKTAKDYQLLIESTFLSKQKISNEEFDLSMSFGFLNYPSDSSDYDEFIQLIDSLTYNIRTFEGLDILNARKDSVIPIGERALISELRNAITEKKILFGFRPIFNAESGFSLDAEIATAFKLPNEVIILEQDFRDTAQKSGLLSNWYSIILESAFEYINNSDRLGHGLNKIALNINAIQLLDTDFLSTLKKASNRKDFPTGRVCLILREVDAAKDFDLLSNTIAAVKGYGFMTALGGFGYNGSNLKELFLLPVDYVTISGPFICDVSNESNGTRSMAREIVKNIQKLGKLTICENIKTAEQAAMAESLHCNYLHGPYYSSALDEQEFEQFIVKQHLSILDQMNRF